jgi:peptide/nickel transport system permease protein
MRTLTESTSKCAQRKGSRWRVAASREKLVGAIGGGTLGCFALMSLARAMATVFDPSLLDPVEPRLASRRVSRGSSCPRAPGFSTRSGWGPTAMDRDIYSRVLYGGRVSLVVGATVAVMSLLFGMLIGLTAGAARWLDGIVMRLMDD